jgi:hypothetical protein
MGSPVGEVGFLALVLKSVPASYHLTVQTIDTNSILTSRASTIFNATPTTIPASDIIALFIREARHRVLQQTREKGGAAIYAGSGGGQKSFNGKSKGGGKLGKSKTVKPKSDITCYNCGKVGHVKVNCWSEGGDKAGQGPHQKSVKKGSGKDAKKEESANVTTTEKLEAFAFSCTSDFTVAFLLSVLKSRLGAIVDSGATRHFCPNKFKFSNFVPMSNWPIRTADGNTLQATGTGDIEITLPNGGEQSTIILKDALCAPGLAFTLISVNCLLKVGCGVNFLGNMCTIRYLNKQVMVTIPESMGLFWSLSGGEPQADYANVALTRMTLFEAH